MNNIYNIYKFFLYFIISLCLEKEILYKVYKYLL